MKPGGGAGRSPHLPHSVIPSSSWTVVVKVIGETKEPFWQAQKKISVVICWHHLPFFFHLPAKPILLLEISFVSFIVSLSHLLVPQFMFIREPNILLARSQKKPVITIAAAKKKTKCLLIFSFLPRSSLIWCMHTHKHTWNRTAITVRDSKWRFDLTCLADLNDLSSRLQLFIIGFF